MGWVTLPLDVNTEDTVASLFLSTGAYYEEHSVETEDPDLNLGSITHLIWVWSKTTLKGLEPIYVSQLFTAIAKHLKQ